jgi:hypothetical protein
MDGANTEVTNGNHSKYIEACFKYKIMDRLESQGTLARNVRKDTRTSLLNISNLQEIEWLT